MNLDFGILWIEDEFDENEETLLKRRVLEAGFIARIVNIPNGDGLEALAEENRHFHRYDLILLDYRLKDAKGDELAPTVRDLFPATNILFYSSAFADVDALREMIAKRRVEGVYCSHRDRFVDRTGQLIDQFSLSMNRLSGMRGLSMRVVAECDEILGQAVRFMTENDEGCAAKTKDLDDDVLKFIEEVTEKYKVAMKGGLDGRLKSRAIDSGKLHKHFRRQSKVVTANPDTFGLSKAQVERLRELRQSTAQYDNEVLGTRNVLGHVVEEETEDGWVLSGSKDIQVGHFPAIRQMFATHIDDFAEMRDIICALMVKKPD